MAALTSEALSREIDQLRAEAGDLSRRVAAATAAAGGRPATSHALLVVAALYAAVLVAARLYSSPGGYCSSALSQQTVVVSSLAVIIYVLLESGSARSERMVLSDRRSVLAARVRDLRRRLIAPGTAVPEHLLGRCHQLRDYLNAAFAVIDEPWWSSAQSLNDMQALLLHYSGFQFFYYAQC